MKRKPLFLVAGTHRTVLMIYTYLIWVRYAPRYYILYRHSQISFTNKNEVYTVFSYSEINFNLKILNFKLKLIFLDVSGVIFHTRWNVIKSTVKSSYYIIKSSNRFLRRCPGQLSKWKWNCAIHPYL